MRKILISVLMVSVVAGVTIAATRAYFTSQSVLGASTLASGTLAINGTAGGTTTMDLGTIAGKMAPGDSTNQVELIIKNDGNLNASWFGFFNTGGNKLQEAIYIKEAKMEFFRGDGTQWETADQFITNGRGSGPAAAYYNTLADKSAAFHVITLENWNKDNAMGAGGGVQMGALKPGNYYKMTFTLAFAPQAGNEYQGYTMPLSYKILSTQVDTAALNALSALDSRLAASLGGLYGWMTTQISHQ